MQTWPMVICVSLVKMNQNRDSHLADLMVAQCSEPAKPLPGTPYIHMDAMTFGMGCCCLQITFQAWNVDEARRVYDALVPVAPIMVSVM